MPQFEAESAANLGQVERPPSPSKEPNDGGTDNEHFYQLALGGNVHRRMFVGSNTFSPLAVSFLTLSSPW